MCTMGTVGFPREGQGSEKHWDGSGSIQSFRAPRGSHCPPVTPSLGTNRAGLEGTSNGR